jgi:hypothetical protein
MMRWHVPTFSLFVRPGVTLDGVTSLHDGSRGADPIAAAARPRAPMTGRLVLLSALLPVLLGGCFTEVGVEPGDGGQTSGSSCIEGAVGCECYGNETCDPGLACETELGRCIPEDCTPGEAACVCAGGRCDAPSECNSGICETPGADDDGDDGGPSTQSASGSDGTSASTATSADDTGTGDDVSTAGSTTSSGPDPDTTDSGEPACDELNVCGPCFECVDLPAGSCGEAHGACMDVGGCMTAVSCLTECGLTGVCFEPCCEGLSGAQVEAVNALLFCRTDHCTSSCSRFEIPTCN